MTNGTATGVVPVGQILPHATVTTAAERSMPEAAFWLSVLLLCLLPIQRFMLPLGLSLADVVLILLIVLGAGLAWRANQPLALPLLLPMWLILMASVVATLVGIQHIDSVIAIGQEIYLFVGFLVLVNLWRSLTASQLDRLMKIWVIIACLETLLALAGMFRVGPSFLYTKPSQDADLAYEIVRAVGTHANANAAAVYLSVSYFVALATPWPRGVRLASAVWLFAGLYATGSNGALLSTAFGTVALILAYTCLQNRRRALLLAGMACCLVILALATALLVEPLLRFAPLHILGSREPLLFQTLGRFSHSLANRIMIIHWAWDIYRHYPWGIGPNGFSTMHGSLHNDYVAFWFERGPLGLIGWLWLIGESIMRPLRSLPFAANGFRRWQLLALSAGVLATAVNAFSHEVSHMRQLWFMIALLFALSLGALERAQTAAAAQPRADEPRWADRAEAGVTYGYN